MAKERDLCNVTVKTVYKAYTGEIAKIVNCKLDINDKLVYLEGKSLNGYCFKDYICFNSNPDEVCYISEHCFDKILFKDFINENKDKLIENGSISTANSIKNEIRNSLIFNDYFYEYQENGIVNTIDAKNFDEELINDIAKDVLDNVDWQCTQSYIDEIDWSDTICFYYKNKLKDKEMEI